MLGLSKALWLWMFVLLGTLILAILAADYAKLPASVFGSLVIYFVLTLISAALHIKYKSSKTAKGVEIASGLWTILMYLTLGGILTAWQWIS
jgi:hypothetical protein